MRLRDVVVTALVVAALPTLAVAQDADPWSVRIGLGVGAIYPDKSLGALPGDSAAAALRTSPMVSVSAAVTTPIQWLQLRAAASRTVQARLTAKTFSHLSSCGPDCRKLNFDHTPLSRGFSATYAMLSAEVAPVKVLSLAPYLEGGLGFKRLAFGDGPTDGFDGLDGSMIGRVYYLGLGVGVPLYGGNLRFSASDTFRSTIDFSHSHDAVLEQIEQSMRHDFRFNVEFLWAPW